MKPMQQRIRLTIKQKLVLCQHFEANKNLTLRQLAAWAHVTFKLPKAPSKSSMERVLAHTVHEQLALERPKLKTLHSITCPELEDSLVKWIQFCEKASLSIVTYDTIRNKANRLRQSIIERMEQSDPDRIKLERMKFSAGWITRFMTRNRLKLRRVHGEAASAPESVVRNGRAELREITKDLLERDIYNIDESAYFYCAVAPQSISSAPMSGRKNVKKRLTIALAVNADGSHKLPLLFIGAARMPRCLNSLSQDDFDDLNYTNSRKGWMTSSIFRKWLEDFNDEMRECGRNVLLLLDNASVHHSHDGETMLFNVTLRFLPPNTTAHLQPLDAGVIRSFKGHLRRIRTDFIVKRVEFLYEVQQIAKLTKAEADKLLYVDIGQAIQWAQEAWSEVTSTTISNCWRHTQILDSSYFQLVSSMESVRICPPTIRFLAL